MFFVGYVGYLFSIANIAHKTDGRMAMHAPGARRIAARMLAATRVGIANIANSLSVCCKLVSTDIGLTSWRYVAWCKKDGGG